MALTCEAFYEKQSKAHIREAKAAKHGICYHFQYKFKKLFRQQIQFKLILITQIIKCKSIKQMLTAAEQRKQSSCCCEQRKAKLTFLSMSFCDKCDKMTENIQFFGNISRLSPKRADEL
jgi:hypothetical protein